MMSAALLPILFANTYHSILDLVSGPTHSEVQTVKTTIRNIISNRDTHSLFVQLIHATSPNLGKILEDGTSESEDESEDPTQRSLLHLTPMWGLDVSTGLLSHGFHQIGKYQNPHSTGLLADRILAFSIYVRWCGWLGSLMHE